MNREIKFMAWSDKEKRWLPEDQVMIRMDGTVYDNIQLGDDWWEVLENATLYFFTDLLDKDGKEIYEGHKIECNHGHIGIIEYDNHHEAGGRFWPVWEDEDGCEICNEKERWYYFKIIGHIAEEGK